MGSWSPSASSRDRLHLALFSLGLLLSACGRLSADGERAPSLSRGGVPPNASSGELPPFPSLVSILGVEGGAYVRWTGALGTGEELAIFSGDDPDSLFEESPVFVSDEGGRQLVGGLSDDTLHWFALGRRANAGEDWRPAGPPLSARPGRPFFVRPDADPASADGLTPQTAFANPFLAILTAGVAGGGNVWLAEGEYPVGNISLLAGVHLAGGFEASFDPSERDPTLHPTILKAGTSGTLLGVLASTTPTSLDGLVLDGDQTSAVGLDSSTTPLELRGVELLRFTGRGMRLRGGESGDPVRVALVDSVFDANGGDGLSVDGAFDLSIDGCRFASNLQEGADLDSLVAPSGRTASLSVRGSVFAGNVAEGLDVDLGLPQVPVPPGGDYAVDVSLSRFEGNGLDGLLVDIDFETAPQWRAAIRISNSVARANGEAGFHLDLDAANDSTLFGLSSSANGTDGILISSESQTGLVPILASAAFSNGGAGARATFGNHVLAASHCAFFGNGEGALVSEVGLSTAVSSVAFLQSEAWSGTLALGSVALEPGAAPPFERAPLAVVPVVSVQGSEVRVASPVPAEEGTLFELDDDGVPRTLAFASSQGVGLEPPPDDPSPVSLAAFARGSSVQENLSLSADSPAAGAGLAPPFAGPVDAGPAVLLGSASPGNGAPRLRDPLTLLSVDPPAGATLGSQASVTLVFDRELDEGRVGPAAVVVRDALGQPRSIATVVDDEEIVVLPPPGGWGRAPFALELFPAIGAKTGELLPGPLALAFSPR